ncbi:MAG: ATP synthase F0 subunit C [Defluviitaleaceae bacterium]|nr:ATP synthase F0 subunit C [Defluviitaleaceae bacterium]
MYESIVGVLTVTAQTGGDPISNILAASAIGAAIAVLASMAPSFTQGLAAGKAVEAVGRQPEATGQIRSTLLIGGVVAETGGVYGLLVALILLFLNPFVDMYIDAIQRL